jgi:purine-nucleoside phosphorylase
MDRNVAQLGEIDAAVVLGSGLSDCFADGELEELGAIEGATVAGHRGRLALWTLDGARILVALGRRHLYEGASAENVTRTVTLAAAAGARHLVVTNAAGGLNPRYGVGDIMLITGLNALMLGSRLPLLHIGDGGSGDGVRSNRGELEQERLVGVLRDALERGVRLQAGVYAAVLGPSYETRAEIRMLRRMGADAVGMSTVPEYVAASRLGMTVTGLSLITNTLSDTARQTLDHSDVVDAGARATRAMRIAIECALGI